MDHKDGDPVILGLVQDAGVEVVDLAFVDGGVRHFDGKLEAIDRFEYKPVARDGFV